MDAHGRNVRPSSTYHPRSTSSMEVDRGADMESTSKLSFEIEVCEDKAEGKKKESEG